MLWAHLKGESIRSLATEHGKSLGAAFRQLDAELEALPHNNLVTQKIL